jgi:hypothetical protein
VFVENRWRDTGKHGEVSSNVITRLDRGRGTECMVSGGRQSWSLGGWRVVLVSPPVFETCPGT